MAYYRAWLKPNYFRRLRITGTRPKRPVPRRAIELGSGTVDVPLHRLALVGVPALAPTAAPVLLNTALLDPQAWMLSPWRS